MDTAPRLVCSGPASRSPAVFSSARRAGVARPNCVWVLRVWADSLELGFSARKLDHSAETSFIFFVHANLSLTHKNNHHAEIPDANLDNHRLLAA